jgi:hypothetical protein
MSGLVKNPGSPGLCMKAGVDLPVLPPVASNIDWERLPCGRDRGVIGVAPAGER